jgi:uncharacterized protein YecT (DUF1311 family)
LAFIRPYQSRLQTDNTLLQNAEQIAKGQNCPPPSMQTTIDNRHHKHEADQALNQLYFNTMEQLKHCE